MAIQLRNVCFSYRDAPHQAVLDIPEWSVTAKERVFIHGPSGCGKSTLLNLISGMIAPLSGEISVLDQRIDGLSRKDRDRFRARHMGYVFQRFNLIPYLSAVENVQLATQFTQRDLKAQSTDDYRSVDQIRALLSALKVEPAVVDRPTSKLSVGQQQRVAIARALVNKPEILIADEPTSSLDRATRDRFMSLLLSMVAEHEITLLFVSHDMGLSSYFSRVDALEDINRAANTAVGHEMA